MGTNRVTEERKRLRKARIGPLGGRQGDCKPIEIDFARHILMKSAKAGELKPKDLVHLSIEAQRLLEFLVQNAFDARSSALGAAEPSSNEDLEKAIWGKHKDSRYTSGAPNPWYDLHGLVSHIRKVLDDKEHLFIKSFRNAYLFMGEIWPQEEEPDVRDEKWGFDETEAKLRQMTVARELGREDVRHTISLPGCLTMEFTLIPRGTFRIGRKISRAELTELIRCPQLDPEISLETPAHFVDITKSFFMATKPVTVGQYRACMTDRKARQRAQFGIVPFPDCWNTSERPWTKLGFPASDSIVKLRGGWGKRDNASWKNTGFPQTDDHPVVNVNWRDAIAFCRWLSEKTGEMVRLPFEAEWEYACRAGSDGLFYWGDDLESARLYCNGADQKMADILGLPSDFFPGKHDYLNTSPVGKFEPNAWGLADMLGNVSEWCADHAREGHNSYTVEAVSDPKGPRKGSRRILRGGNWYRGPLTCRCAARSSRNALGRSCLTGFRVVMDCPSATRASRSSTHEVALWGSNPRQE